MRLESYISFRDELMKIASLDAGMRATMAARAGLRPGIEYLPGGELPSNDPTQTGFMPKVAGAREIESETYKKYKRYREPGKAALTGALPGAWIANMVGPAKMGKNPMRAGALLGAGAGVADWVASGKARKWAEAPGKAKADAKGEDYKKTLPRIRKTAMMGSQTFSPAMAKAQSSAVGSFQDKTIHKGSRLRPMKLGQNFSIPSEPGQ